MPSTPVTHGQELDPKPYTLNLDLNPTPSTYTAFHPRPYMHPATQTLHCIADPIRNQDPEAQRTVDAG